MMIHVFLFCVINFRKSKVYLSTLSDYPGIGKSVSQSDNLIGIMWHKQRYAGFDTGKHHRTQLHVHPGKIPLNESTVLFMSVCLSHPSPRLQNPTNSKYHLSAITLLANWSDMTGKSSATSNMLHVLLMSPVHSNPQPPDPSLPTAPLSAGNTSLDYLRSTLGRSYMCNAEQILDVAPAFSLNTFRLQVQPFQVTTNQFASGTRVGFTAIM